jgi:hypothetical protein
VYSTTGAAAEMPERRANLLAACPRSADRRSRRVFDQHGRHGRIHLTHGRLEIRANHDHDARAPDHDALDPAEDARQPAAAAIAEVRHLLRQARVHVVEVRLAEEPREHHANRAALFVRVDRVVLPREREPARRERDRGIERDLGP